MKLTKFVPADIYSAFDDAHTDLFKQLFKLHAPGIYRLAYNQLRERTAAQEIVQECFLNFWEKRQEIGTNPTAIKGYLYTSAYHAALTQVRQQRKRTYQDYPEDLAAEQAIPTAELEYQELSLYYTHALAQLPAKRREVFAMSRQQGLPNATIAKELNISIKTVEAQITQALKFIRHYFTVRGILPTLFIWLTINS